MKDSREAEIYQVFETLGLNDERVRRKYQEWSGPSEEVKPYRVGTKVISPSIGR